MRRLVEIPLDLLSPFRNNRKKEQGLVPLTPLYTGVSNESHIRMEIEDLTSVGSLYIIKNSKNMKPKLQTRLMLATWNARSLKANFLKVKALIDLNLDIILVQETWLDRDVTDSYLLSLLDYLGGKYRYRRMDRISKKNKSGGGTILFVKSGIEVIKEVRINKDSGLYQIVANTVEGTRTLWICNVYLSRGSKKQIQRVFKKVESIIPPEYLKNTCLIGDFNVNLVESSDPKELLIGLASSLGLQLFHTIQGTRKDAILDFAIGSKRTKCLCQPLSIEGSDHKSVLIELADIPRIERRRIKIVNKKFAESISLKAIQDASNSNEFLEALKEAHTNHQARIYVTLNQRKIERKLFKRIVHSGETTRSLIMKYWKEVFEENEEMRFSHLSRDAFQTLKRMSRYDQFGKRDGSIVNKIMKDGQVVTEEDEVNRLLIEQLKSHQWNPNREIYIEGNETPFPYLDVLAHEEMKEILGQISRHKALAGDLVSDIILDQEHLDNTADVLKDLWCGKQLGSQHFQCRLVALNKAHPEIPRPDQFRPVIITSLIVKILEARLLKPLREYAVLRLNRSQTGFVPGMSVNVNICRLVNHLRERRESKLRTYLLFLDFTSAYNTVLHQELFTILEKKNVLDQSQIQLLKAIYSRISIGLGEESFRPNIGVAQGSIISPYLFDIYAESLLDELESLGWKLNDLYGFADDHLVLNCTLSDLRRCINIVREWGIKYNVKLNPAKSGVLEVPPKYGKITLEVGSVFEGVPVVDSYKYLGLWLTQKLTAEKHLDYLFGKKGAPEGRAVGKINYLVSSLRPCLSNVSLDYRLNLWVVLVKPLFLPLAAMAWSMSRNDRETVQTKLRVSLKKFIGLPKNFRTDVLTKLFPLDYEEWINIEYENNTAKWLRRLRYQPNTQEGQKKYLTGYYRCLPKEFGMLLKRFTVVCRECQKPFYPEHLADHGVHGLDLEELFKRMDGIKADMLRSSGQDGGMGNRKIRLPRKQLLDKYTSFVMDLIGEIDVVLREFADTRRVY